LSTVFSNVEIGEELYLHNWVKTPFPGRGHSRIYTFHEGLAVKTLSAAGLLKDFANSFLILAGEGDTGKLSEPDWAAKQFTICDRRAKYRCITTLRTKPGIRIEKKTLDADVSDQENNPVIKHNISDSDVCFFRIEKKTLDADVSDQENNPVIKHNISDSVWQRGNLVMFEVYKILLENDFERSLSNLFKEHYQELLNRYSIGKEDKEGFPLVRGEALDFIFRNIIRQDGNLVPIDAEWETRDVIPADYVLYRCVCDVFVAQYPGTGKRIRYPNRFAVRIIKNIFSQYGRNRHRKNKQFERSFQELVRKKMFWNE